MDEKRLLNEMGKISCFLKPDSSARCFEYEKEGKKEKKMKTIVSSISMNMHNLSIV